MVHRKLRQYYFSHSRQNAPEQIQTLNTKEHPMLGIELFVFLRKSEDYNVLSSPGISKKANNIFKYLGIYTNHLKHFVLINNKITNILFFIETIMTR